MNVIHKICRPDGLKTIVSAGAFLLCSAAAIGLAGQDLSSPDSVDAKRAVTIEYSALNHATSYTASSGDCSITWIAYDNGPNQGIIKHSPRCDAPMELQISLMTKICTAFFGHDKNARTYRTLFWGGLEAEQKPASQDLQFRLALAAYRSPGWDARKGKPKNGDINGFIRKLANETPIYRELQELFRGFDMQIKLASVEKVRVLEAGKLPFYSRLRQQGVAATDRLPFDCMAWFSLSVLSQ